MPIDVAAGTDVGRVRAVNQDTASAGTFRSGAAASLAVVDGLGGHAGGEVASALAIEAIAAASARTLRTGSFHPGAGADAIRSALLAAHNAIRERAAREPSLTGMGAVAVTAWLTEDALLLAHAGDARAYLLDDAGMRSVTADHTWVADAVRAGAITAEAAARHPRRHMVLQALGASAQVSVEVTGPLPLQAGARVLLCSDGLHGVAEESAIATILGAETAPAAVRRLIAAANEAGGPDNIGVAVARIGTGRAGRPGLLA